MSARVSDYPNEPYPGARPEFSYVSDGEHVLEVRVDDHMASGWSLEVAGTARDLDGWLLEQGAPPLALRVPVLAYGSNVNPWKLLNSGWETAYTRPAVVLRATLHDHCAVLAVGRSWRGQVPATIVELAGVSEVHALLMCTRDDLANLDEVEGRFAEPPRYALRRLRAGSVRVAGSDAGHVLAYEGSSEQRQPARDAHGRHLPLLPASRDVLANHAMHRLAGMRAGWSGRVGLAVDAHPTSTDLCDLLFVHGTLMPGQSRWPTLRQVIAGDPVPAATTGRLMGTGAGDPALLPGDQQVSGALVRICEQGSEAAWQLLDEIEGAADPRRQYRRVRRRVRTATGSAWAWTYIYACDTSGKTDREGAALRAGR